MSKQLKPYALAVSVKPKPFVSVKYTSRTYYGIVLASSPRIAKELATNSMLDNFKDLDGSSMKKPLVDRDCITIKQCKLFGDFFIHTK